MYISASSQEPIPNLGELQDSVSRFGGSIICYQRMYSFLFFSQSSPVFVWLAPGNSRMMASLPHVGFTLAFGWWSIFGWLSTPFVIAGNLAGGEEVTRRVMRMSASAPPAPASVEIMGFTVPGTGSKDSLNADENIDPLIIEEQQREQQRQGWVAGTLLGVIFVASMIFFISCQLSRR